MSDWTGAPAPGGAHVSIRSVEFGRALVTVHTGPYAQISVGVEEDERQGAAEALAGDDYIVVRRAKLAEMFDDLLTRRREDHA